MRTRFTRRSRKRNGFSIIEVMVAAAILSVIVAATVSSLIYGLRVWKKARVENELNIDLEVAVGYLRKDLRLSSMSIGGSMAFYPATAVIYTAISLPLAHDDDGDNLIERDADGKILWDETIIYHVREGSPDELVRVCFKPKFQDATPAQVYNQLVRVVNGETDTACLTGEVYSSKIVFKNLVDLQITSVPTFYDGYSPDEKKDYGFNFGSVVLGPGNHTLKLELTGRNPASTGYKLGIDKFTMSASDSVREGEYYLSDETYGIYTYTNSPGSKTSVSNMSHVLGYIYGGDMQMNFEPPNLTPVGSWLSLDVYNDFWHDPYFDIPGGSWVENTKIVSNTYVTCERGITWNAKELSREDYPRTDGAPHVGDQVVTYIYGEFELGSPSLDTIALNGRYTRVRFSGPGGLYTNKALKIGNVFIVNVDDGISQRLLFTSQPPGVSASGTKDEVAIRAGYTGWSDWVDWTIEKQKTYAVTFIVDADPKNDGLQYWPTMSKASEINGVDSTNAYVITDVEVRYPDSSWFRSGIYDTTMDDPRYNRLRWRHIEKNQNGEDYYEMGGTIVADIDVKVRAGDDPDLQMGTWLPGIPLTEPYYFAGGETPDVNIGALPQGRYIQYEALLTCKPGAENEHAPELLDVLIDWPGPIGLVDLDMDLGKGPDYGIYTATVDGHVLARGLEIEMQIFKDSGHLGRMHTVRNTMQIIPLNTGK